MILTIIPAAGEARFKSVLLKIYFNDDFNNNSRRPMAAAGEARFKSVLLKNIF
jgi:hypothetical protein